MYFDLATRSVPIQVKYEPWVYLIRKVTDSNHTVGWSRSHISRSSSGTAGGCLHKVNAVQMTKLGMYANMSCLMTVNGMIVNATLDSL